MVGSREQDCAATAVQGVAKKVEAARAVVETAAEAKVVVREAETGVGMAVAATAAAERAAGKAEVGGILEERWVGASELDLEAHSDSGLEAALVSDWAANSVSGWGAAEHSEVVC